MSYVCDVYTHTCFIPDIHTMEYYSTIKKNENLLLTAAWRDSKGIILSEITQTEKYKYCMTSLICGI